MLTLLFDADMLIYRACSAAETEINWYGDLWTLHSDISECKDKIDEMVVAITDRVLNNLKYEGTYGIIMCTSSRTNFRKTVLPTYKLNRAARRKPLAYSAVKEWVRQNYTTLEIDDLEADDVIGIEATAPGANAVIISGDKDFKSIPGLFYNFIHDEFYKTSLAEANYYHLFQTLVGDITDNYKGCPKIGTVGAKKLLDKSPTWATVVSAFEKAGLDEEEALVNARCARILRASDYEDGKVKLWTPK